ncbi:MAG: hypothetical protein LBF39_04300 [Prevotellaceae bacterium]|nr:hypothetical protein [Prevotellaceae bacterium]
MSVAAKITINYGTEAQFLQQFAFAHDVIERITLPSLRERIADLVGKRLRGELHPCAGCARHCC